MNELLTKYFEARKAHDQLLKKLDNETHRIIKVITKIFKETNYWWAFSYYEGDEQPLPEKPMAGIFPIYISTECATDDMDYSGGFPVEFFDMTDEEIAAHIKKHIKECEEIAEKQKAFDDAKQLAKKFKNAEIKKSALAKLTTEEIKALKIK